MDKRRFPDSIAIGPAQELTILGQTSQLRRPIKGRIWHGASWRVGV